MPALVGLSPANDEDDPLGVLAGNNTTKIPSSNSTLESEKGMDALASGNSSDDRRKVIRDVGLPAASAPFVPITQAHHFSHAETPPRRDDSGLGEFLDSLLEEG